MKKRNQRNKKIISILLVAACMAFLAGMGGFLLARVGRQVVAVIGNGNKTEAAAESRNVADEREAEIPSSEQWNTAQPPLAKTAQKSAKASAKKTAKHINMDTLSVGTILSKKRVKGQEEHGFVSYEIAEGDAVYGRIIGKSYRPNDDVALSDLRYLKMLHYNFEHKIQVGEMIVNKDVSDDVLAIFLELFQNEYEIDSMRLVDDFWAGDGDRSDYASIDANNTSAFCYRQVTGGSSLSNHAFGRAIDLNPQQNPYVRFAEDGAHWAHQNANAYIDRNTGLAHVITPGDLCYTIFSQHGFSWGGDWTNPKDYQHFERPRQQ